VLINLHWTGQRGFADVTRVCFGGKYLRGIAILMVEDCVRQTFNETFNDFFNNRVKTVCVAG
jgi:hypothetical protein